MFSTRLQCGAFYSGARVRVNAPPQAAGQLRLKRHIVDCAFRRACRRAGIKDLRFHDLRHEYGSRLGDADVNLKKIARLMGHSNTRQTERYVHPDDEGLLVATEIATRQTAGESTRIVPRAVGSAG